MKDLMEKGQVQEMKAKALLHLDQAFDGAVAASKSSSPSCSIFNGTSTGGSNGDEIYDNDATGYDYDLSRVDSPDATNAKVTPSPRLKRTSKCIQGISDLERMQRNLKELKEKKSQSRLQILKEREQRKQKEAETAQLEQENSRLRLELQNSQIQANIKLQQQMMEQQLQMQHHVDLLRFQR